MYFQCAAAALGLLAVFQSLSLAGDSLGDTVFYQVFHLLLGGVTQDQDGHGDAAQAQLHSFVYAAHRQIIRAILLQHPRHLNGAVAIGICLHHAQELHAPSNVPAQLFVVFLQGVQVNNRPGPLQCRFHSIRLSIFVFLVKSPPAAAVSGSFRIAFERTLVLPRLHLTGKLHKCHGQQHLSIPAQLGCIGCKGLRLHP